MGQIARAELDFQDLTVLVGPQATGKSICLQLLKLLLDQNFVLSELRRYGLEWDRDVHRFLDVYLGEGMGTLWRDDSTLSLDDRKINLADVVGRKRKTRAEIMFFIPAQRVLTIGRGWPRPFSEYSSGDPFCVRDFSEKLRLLMETGLGKGETKLFPQPGRLKSAIRDLLSETIFAQFGLMVDVHGLQKRFVLQAKGTASNGNGNLPFMVWSAGQREFVPFLLGYYWLCPSTKVSRRGKLRWVVIEELEMGLHPRAISAVMVMILELLRRGYRVCLSTHSPHVLDVVWAMRMLREANAEPKQLLKIFEVSSTPQTLKMAESALNSRVGVYLFGQDGKTKDISSLDPGSDNQSEAGWGGLTEFSGRVADVVADVMGGGG